MATCPGRSPNGNVITRVRPRPAQSCSIEAALPPLQYGGVLIYIAALTPDAELVGWLTRHFPPICASTARCGSSSAKRRSSAAVLRQRTGIGFGQGHALLLQIGQGDAEAGSCQSNGRSCCSTVPTARPSRSTSTA